VRLHGNRDNASWRARTVGPRALVGAVVAAFLVCAPPLYADSLPPFTVSAQNGTELALLVDQGTTHAQLKALVLALREARGRNQLGRLIPPTTPRGKAGPYAIVVVYVYSDPQWATPEALRRCNKASFGTPLFDKCSANVRAHYFYSVMASPNEIGTVGYAEGKRVYTKDYEKLFGSEGPQPTQSAATPPKDPKESAIAACRAALGPRIETTGGNVGAGELNVVARCSDGRRCLCWATRRGQAWTTEVLR
jgi:hypothetical protein